ncbi:MAG TPA: glycoside hydrolase family 38 C-terminal domain-containing protein, partial [Acidimicrobiales bacterium]|nr:glycoside hydrolase family 38 C-terminal domain-containing protein [Acidimicrobiales bacterium]
GVEQGAIAVVNPLGWDRAEVVTVAGLGGSGVVAVEDLGSGTITPGQYGPEGLSFLARVGAFGTAAYRAGGPWSGAATPVPPSDRQGHELHLRDERPRGMSAWELGALAQETILVASEPITVEDGPVRLVQEVRYQARSSAVTQRIVSYAHTPRVDFHTTIEWREPGNAEVGIPGLKASFTALLRRPEAWFETPFGAVERPAGGAEVPALRWAAVESAHDGKGYAVLNDCKYGYDALGGRLRLSLVRTAYDPDTASDIGMHQCTYSLVPYTGEWRAAEITRQAAGLNQPLLARVAGASAGAAAPAWRPVVAPGPVVMSCFKAARQGSGRVVRLYESTGRPAPSSVGGIPPGAEVWEATVTEDPLHRLDVDPAGQVALAFRPWQVRTLLITG